jgi:hypothetical protein
MRPRYTVNCSLLLTDLPLLERPAAAKAAGFDAVEFWRPFTVAGPRDRDIDGFAAAVIDADVTLTGLNFFAGDMPGGDRGWSRGRARRRVPRQRRHHRGTRTTSGRHRFQRAARQPDRRRRHVVSAFGDRRGTELHSRGQSAWPPGRLVRPGGDDAHGRLIHQVLRSEDVDTSRIMTDDEALTGLIIQDCHPGRPSDRLGLPELEAVERFLNRFSDLLTPGAPR